MKKITILLTTAALSTTVFITAARADSYNYSPYIGADYVFNRTNTYGVHPQHHALGIHIGSDYSKYFGTELFINQSNQNKTSYQTGKLTTSYYSYGLDILAFLPLGTSEKFALAATAGFGEYAYKTKINPTNRHREHGYGYRFGGGARYAFDRHWHTRMLCRYVNFDQLREYDHDMEYSLSIEYHF